MNAPHNHESISIEAYSSADEEMQPILARDALLGLDYLLTSQPRGEQIRCEWVGAMIRLIVQAAG